MRKFAPTILFIAASLAVQSTTAAAQAPVARPQLTGHHYGGSVNVYMVSATPGAGIKYTTDGSEPTTRSATYSSPLVLTASATVKARAYKSGMAASSVTTATYTVYNVTRIDFEAEHSPLDANPNAGGGMRMFPERRGTWDTNFRDSVIVVATVSPAVPNLQVDFRVFDPDDPSSNAAPVDPNGAAGDDNLQDLTFRPLKGTLSGGGARTDRFGKARVRLTIGWQPGNNYVVAATTSSSYASGLRLRASNGAVVEDRDGGALPSARAKLSPMLTAWRRVHVEVDRMANVIGNAVTGQVAAVTTTPLRGTSTIDLGLNLPAPGALGTDGLLNRFEGGTITITVNGSSTAYSVISSTAAVSGNDRVVVSGIVPAAAQGQRYRLVDDDEAHGYGDGAEIPFPDTGRLVACFAPAYVLPVFDLPNVRPTVPFVLNTGSSAGDLLQLYRFDNNINFAEKQQTYWVVYVLGALQGPVGEDGDPDDSNNDGRLDEPGGIAVGTVDALNGVGAVIYYEGLYERSGGRRVPTNSVGTGEQDVVAHKVAHLFGAEHADGGIMSQTSNVFTPHSLRKIRSVIHP